MVSSQAAQAVASVVQLQHQLQRALLWIRPDGGQAKARRNAWAAMVAPSQRRHDRPIVDRVNQDHENQDRKSQSAASVAGARSSAAAVSARELAIAR